MKTQKISIIITMITFCCLNNNFILAQNTHPVKEKYYLKGKQLIKETFDNTGKIREKQFFNRDTIPDGACTVYYPNGKIHEWYWYTLDDIHPICCVFYNRNGVFDSIGGRPFIECTDEKDSLYISMIDPPSITSYVILDDSSHDNRVNLKYKPFNYRSKSWVILDEKGEISHFKNHVYRLYYFAVDKPKNRVYRAPSCLHLEGGHKYEFTKTPSKNFKLSDIR